MEDVLIVKIGGAAVTDKRVRRSLRHDAVAEIARALARCTAKIIIVHGAGSFGHHEASAARLSSHDPADDFRKTPLSIAACRASLAALHSALLDSLTHAGVPALTVPTAGAPSGAVCVAVELALARGFVPVLHGDVALGPPRSGGAHPFSCAIVSGDALVVALAHHFDASRAFVARIAVFVTGAACVYATPPPEGDGSSSVGSALLPARISHLDVVCRCSGTHRAAINDSGASGVDSDPYECVARSAGSSSSEGGSVAAPPTLATAPLDTTGGLAAKLSEACGAVWARGARCGNRSTPPLTVRIVGVADAQRELERISVSAALPQKEDVFEDVTYGTTIAARPCARCGRR